MTEAPASPPAPSEGVASAEPRESDAGSAAEIQPPEGTPASGGEEGSSPGEPADPNLADREAADQESPEPEDPVSEAPEEEAATEGSPDEESSGEETPEEEIPDEPEGVAVEIEEGELEVLTEVESEILGEEKTLRLPVAPEWVGRRLMVAVRYESRSEPSEPSELRELDVTAPLPTVSAIDTEVSDGSVALRWDDLRPAAAAAAPLSRPLFEVYRRRGAETRRMALVPAPAWTDGSVVWGAEVCYSVQLVALGDDEPRLLDDPGPEADSDPGAGAAEPPASSAEAGEEPSGEPGAPSGGSVAVAEPIPAEPGETRVETSTETPVPTTVEEEPPTASRATPVEEARTPDSPSTADEPLPPGSTTTAQGPEEGGASVEQPAVETGGDTAEIRVEREPPTVGAEGAARGEEAPSAESLAAVDEPGSPGPTGTAEGSDESGAAAERQPVVEVGGSPAEAPVEGAPPTAGAEGVARGEEAPSPDRLAAVEEPAPPGPTATAEGLDESGAAAERQATVEAGGAPVVTPVEGELPAAEAEGAPAEAEWTPVIVRVPPTGAEAVSAGPRSREACLVPEDLYPPAPPTDVRAFWQPEGTDLNWEASAASDVALYRVYRSRTEDSGYELLVEAPADLLAFTDRNRDSATAYYYAVTAVDAAASPNESPRSVPVRVRPRSP